MKLKLLKCFILKGFNTKKPTRQAINSKFNLFMFLMTYGNFEVIQVFEANEQSKACNCLDAKAKKA